MTIEECYRELGGSYDEVSQRLPSLSLVERFIGRFPDDRSFDTLCEQLGAGDRAEAFRAAHTLKGVCANLSFSRLLGSVSRLTEELRPAADVIPPAAAGMLEDVRQDYRLTVDAIHRYFVEK